MSEQRFKLDAYLARLNYSGAVQPTEDRLEALHRAQFFAIPFENFDILLGREISLEPDALFDKLVTRPRGGYCFELNGLFLMALKAFGFEVRPLLARVHLSGIPSGRGHQIALATIHGRQWITDVGFGKQNLRAPLLLEHDQPKTRDGFTHRFRDAERFGTMLQYQTGGSWQDLYSFDLGHVYPADIAYGNYYTSTNPNSFFTFARVAALPVHDGTITLFNSTLTKISGNRELVQEIPEGQAYLNGLKTHFGIELDAPYEALTPLLDTARGEASASGF
jgi:N-hydroxyarylamine O-acetyltransferase